MVRDTWAYREVAVESVVDPATGRLRLRPMPGQAYPPTLRVQCSRKLLDPGLYPAGTCFLLSAKLTDRMGGKAFLYAYHGDPAVVLSREQANKFLAEYRRLRI
jgi:hypothetical protein